MWMNGDSGTERRLAWAGLALAAHFACWIASLRYASVAVSTLLVCTTPVWTEAFAIAMGQEIRYDETGNVVTGSFMDFFMPTAVETPHWETDFTVTPSPHHPIGAKGVGESPNVGGVPAFSNAVNDAFSFLGSTHIQMPHDYWRNWRAAKNLGVLAA